jgi:predicted nucleic acid-binding protein
MPDKLTISNTSPLLYLHLVRLLDLLPRLYGEVFVPPAVEAEFQAGAERGVDVPRIGALPWLKVMPLASDTSMSPVISALREAGLWLSDLLVAEVLRQVGEE